MVWKRLLQVIILKKSQKDNLGNYGQVSLTSHPGKIMECDHGTIPLDNIGGHVNVNESLQRGFTNGMSYPTSLFTFCDKIT